MEKEVSDIYRRASSEISEKWGKYMKSHEPKVKKAYDDLQEALKSGDKDAINGARDTYERTVRNVTLNNERFITMVDETTSRIAHVNEVALNYVNDEMPKIYAINYNDFGNQEISGYSFTLVNEQAVKNLIKEDKSLLPLKKLDISKDKLWNTKSINAEVLQGILQGENIPKIAKRLQNVTDMNRKSAIRNARTMTTGAENKGKQDSFKKAQSDGVIMKRRWVATHDDRTRAWHVDLDGIEVDVDEPWENDYGEIMYPGDPTADPGNVYNCRCAIRAVVKGFAWNNQVEEQSRYVNLSDKSYSETREWFNENSNLEEWMENIEDLEYYDSIGKYSGEYYGVVNDYLRSGDFHAPNKYVDESDVKNIINELDQSVSQFNLESPITVYRSSGTEIFGGENLSYEDLKSRMGDVVHDNAYLSTSTLKKLPGEQTVGGNTSYIIDIPSGNGQGAYIARFSENHQEREFLIAREGDYRIEDVFKDEDGRVNVHLSYLGTNEEGHLDKNGLTLEERGELMSYKSFDFYEINDVLREKGLSGLDERQREKVDVLDSALSKLPTYSGDVSRSLYFSDEDKLNEYVQGVQASSKLDSPAYLSTTKNIEELYNPEGQVQIYIDDSKSGRDLRDYDNGENEVLYERNAKIDIVEQGWKDGVYIIRAKERK